MGERTKRKRQRGYTRVSSKRQVTIPPHVLAETGVAPGDVLKIESDGRGRIIMSPAQTLGERRRAAIAATAGSLTGVYEPGSLDRLRDEWR